MLPWHDIKGHQATGKKIKRMRLFLVNQNKLNLLYHILVELTEETETLPTVQGFLTLVLLSVCVSL